MKPSYYLGLDIGTEAVKAAILKSENQGRVLIKTVLQYYDKFGLFDSREWEKDVIKKAILKARESLRALTGIKAESAFLSLPPDIFKARVSPQSLERKNPEKVISGREEREIREEILIKNKRAVSQDFFRECGIMPQELEFLEQLFLEIKIDGYQVPSFQGYQGRKIEAGILSIFLAKEYLHNFQQILKELKLVVFKIIHPAQNLAKLFKNRDGIFLDVGGKITQIFVVKKGKLAMVADFPMAGEDFSKTLWQKLGLKEERARVLKERYSRGEMSEKTRKEFNEIFSEVSEEWYHNLNLKLKSFQEFLPPTIFLFGGSSQLPEIQEILEEKWSVEVLKNPQEINLTLFTNAQ